MWLLLDDEAVTLVGGWEDAVRAMAAHRLQPSLLFYEQDAAQQQQPLAPQPAAEAAAAVRAAVRAAAGSVAAANGNGVEHDEYGAANGSAAAGGGQVAVRAARPGTLGPVGGMAEPPRVRVATA